MDSVASEVGKKRENRIGSDAAMEIVGELYRQLLMREPDDAGLLTNAERYRQDGDFASLVRSFLTSEEFKHNIRMFSRNVAPDEAMTFVNDHSQFGEVGLLIRRIVAKATPYRIVVDVGARGIDRSNSFDLMKQWDWRGILIEANPALIPEIQLGFQRLDCEVINAAVSSEEGAATFYLGANDDVSSLSEDQAAAWGKGRGSVQVQMRRLPTILAERGIPRDFELLSLDIEGFDIIVLNDLIDNSPYRPKWIIIEASHNFTVKTLYDKPFSQKVAANYSIVATTEANLLLEYQEDR